jgi:sialate O-acetylesterase
MRSLRGVAAVAVGMACSAAWAEVKLASVFTDHMVLQRDKAVRVWGTAEAGKRVTVKVGGKEESAKADKEGRWSVKLGAAKASATPAEMVVSEEGGNTVTISDVLYGDVWVCSGQSNMAFQLQRAHNAAEAVAGATDPLIRLLEVPRKTGETPALEQAGKWAVCSPETAKGFSAVAYFFAKDVRAAEGVPVGLVGTYWGGTAAEAWTPKSHLEDSEWAPLWEKDRAHLAAYPAARAKWEEQVKAWEAKPAASRGRKPAEPAGGPSYHHRPAVLWNGMVEPLVPMSIAGAIWYQGENNAPRAEYYRSVFPNMIEAWRDHFKQGDFPFLFVQLANYTTKLDTPEGSAWAELREAQAMALTLPRTGMAVAIDVGDPKDIHPTDKQTIGKRLATVAAKVAYGRDVQAAGPTYRSMDVDGKEATLTFRNAKQLVVKGEKVKGFTVAGADKRFVPAEARVEGNTVVVSSPEVSKPVAVRYAWKDNPEVSLYNAAGLPMVPFRTDDWPAITAGKK